MACFLKTSIKLTPGGKGRRRHGGNNGGNGLTMETHESSDTLNLKNNRNDHKQNYYSRLFRKFTFLTMVCSLVPLLLVGWGINIHYTRLSKERMINSFKSRVENHRKIIELFLKERTSKLQLIAHTHSRSYLTEISNLAHVFEMINMDKGAITDLGVIDESGRHLSYIGPYDLLSKNYSREFWFKNVMEQDVYVSDMFMGFRREPHFIIAVTNSENEKKWILRATINTEAFRSLVENVRVGETGEVLLLNKTGVYQTSPRFSGKIMEQAPFSVSPLDERIETCISEDDADSPEQIMAKTWLKNPEWLLVVKQNYSEAFEEVNYANYASLVFLHLSALSILIVCVFVTRHMINVIKKRDIEADGLNRQLVQAGKLASIGELSAGVAHEINNPLSILMTEKQILLDLFNKTPIQDTVFKEQFMKSMAQTAVQINRCKKITHNLLRFARRTKSVIETVDINDFIKEIIDLMEREAKTSGIKFLSDLDSTVPPVLTDPSQLQQVFLNIITNAIDAHNGKPYGSIQIITMNDEHNQGIRLKFIDTGSGISHDNIDKVFDPFFTTKAVGSGTGLGLSICYSIIKHLGGDISVKSEVGKGTEFAVFVPYDLPASLKEGIAEPEGST